MIRLGSLFISAITKNHNEMAKDLVKRTCFCVDLDMNATHAYLIAHCPKFFDPVFTGSVRDLSDYGCTFIDPGYRWLRAPTARTENASLTTLTISDKTVVAGLSTILNDADYIVGRWFLSMNADVSAVKIVPLPQYPDTKGYTSD